MDPSHLTQLVELEDSYWWHVAKRRLVTRLLRRFCPPPGRVVEGGIGSGRNLAEFNEIGYDVTGFDLMPESVAHVRERGIEDVHVHDLGEPWPVDAGSLRAVVLLDVLEHVEDPVNVLSHAWNALADDGAIVITVPAYPWLYSRWDEQLGHYRRYTVAEFRRQARQSGFRVQWLNHWNSFTLPAALAVRGWEKLFPRRSQPDFPDVSPLTNRLLLTAAAAETRVHGLARDSGGIVAGRSSEEMNERASNTRRPDSLISVVMPVFNEAGILQELNQRVIDVLDRTGRSFEIVYANDGSTDGSREILAKLAAADHRVVVVHLSRNFGHQPALHAGLCQASGDAVIVMDSDLQDNPDAIPAFLHQWDVGYDVVYAERFNRKESALKRFLFYSFYRVLNAVADSRIPQDAGNFGLLDRCVVDAMRQMPECDRWFPGLRSWVGFRQIGVPVERDARYDDKARVSLQGLFRLAKTAIFSFSGFPLTLFYFIAALSAAVCGIATGFVVYHKIVTGLALPGWASVIITASFFGALNALGISVLGEYDSHRIYDQVRNRPIQITEQVLNAGASRAADLVRTSGPKSEALEQEVLEMLLQIDKTLRGGTSDSKVNPVSGR